MRYELLLQPLEAALPYEAERVEPLLAAHGVGPFEGDGARPWRLEQGRVELRPLRDGPQVRGLELHVELSDQLELIREAVKRASALATDAGLRLYDPQLSRTLSANDADLVADQYLRTARYAGEMLGVSGALGASYATPDEGTTGAATKLLFWAIGGALVLFVIFEVISR